MPSIFNAKGSQRKSRYMALKLDGVAATPALDEGSIDAASVDDNGVGDYTINFATAYERVPVVVALSRTASIHVRCVPSLTDVQILCFSDLGETTPAEAELDIMILGWDSADAF